VSGYCTTPRKADKENNQEDKEIAESASESFRQGWSDAMMGNFACISTVGRN